MGQIDLLRFNNLPTVENREEIESNIDSHLENFHQKVNNLFKDGSTWLCLPQKCLMLIIYVIKDVTKYVITFNECCRNSTSNSVS